MPPHPAPPGAAPEPARSPWRGSDDNYRPRRSRPAIVLALAVHLALVGLLGVSLHWRSRERPAPAPWPVQWLVLPRPPLPPPHAAVTLPARPQRDALPPRRAAAPAAIGRAHAIDVPRASAADDRPAAVAALAASAASAPPPLRLDAQTLQRAVRDAARRPSIGEQAAQASDEPPRPTRQQALGQGIARGARGNCLKGEYAGGGMGLLSVPFFLAAEASGHCGR